MKNPSELSKNKKQRPKISAWALNLLLVFCSLLLPLLVAEASLRLTHHKTISFDDRSFRQSAWAFKPNTSAESYVGVPVRINNLGMRGADTTAAKPPGVFRILGVGDSITFGYGVEYDKTFLQVLERRLNSENGGKVRYEVLNTGIPATGLDYYTHVIEASQDKLQPDLILVCMALNDIDPDLGPEPREPSSPKSAFRSLNQFFLTHSYLYNALFVPVKSLLYQLNILKLKDNEGFGFLAIEPDSEAQQKARRMMTLYLTRLARFAKAHNTPLAVVVFPVEVQLSPGARRTYAEKLHLDFGPEVEEGQPQEWVQQEGRQNGFPVLDLLPALRGVSPGQAFLRNHSISVDPVHPSEEGDRAAGEAIAGFLRENKLLANDR
jgi:lysophospholipase L1-like esterase